MAVRRTRGSRRGHPHASRAICPETGNSPVSTVRIDGAAPRFAYPARVKPILSLDQDAMAQMAAAIRLRLGDDAPGFARRQLAAADGDMVTVWAAIVTHLESGR